MERIFRTAVRLAMLARRPRSGRWLVIAGIVAVGALVIAGLDHYGWWPDWARR